MHAPGILCLHPPACLPPLPWGGRARTALGRFRQLPLARPTAVPSTAAVAVQGKRSEQPPELLDSELAQLLWQELGAKCVYASTVTVGKPRAA